MDNLGATGSSQSEDVFSYVPPNLMYDGFKNTSLPREQAERKQYYYEQFLDMEDKEEHIRNSSK